MPLPRPCLKAELHTETDPLPFASCPKVLLSPHVHFPPSPTLTSTYMADSPWTYDRAPITISPNSCELPERGGRMYTQTSENWNLKQRKGSYFHPRAYEVCESEPPGAPIAAPSPPLLIPDLSSESDESDGAVVTTPDSSTMIPSISAHFAQHSQHSPIPHACSQDKIDNAFSFLPHPPEPMKDKKKGRRRSSSRSQPEAGTYRWNTKSMDAFAEPALDDGCLGGF